MQPSRSADVGRPLSLVATMPPQSSPSPESEPVSLAVSPAVAARMIGISRGKLYQLLYQEEIPSFLVGRRRCVPVAALQRWMDEQVAAAGDTRR